MNQLPKFFVTTAIVALISVNSIQAACIPPFCLRPSEPSQVQPIDTSPKNYGYELTNDCRFPVRLAIHYKDLNNEWQTRAWWDFAPGETARLNGVRSTNDTWYFYAETTDGSYSWKGDLPINFQGRQLMMKKKIDDEGTNELTLSCN